MSKSVVILVTENPETMEYTKKTYEGKDVQVQTYTPYQWREGMDNAFFRQQLMNGVPALMSGSNHEPHPHHGNHENVLAFPTATANSPHVQKMEHLEAHAIENAIMQYKGNLTEAAKALGIGRATLYRKVKQYHIDPSSARKKRAA